MMFDAHDLAKRMLKEGAKTVIILALVFGTPLGIGILLGMWMSCGG